MDKKLLLLFTIITSSFYCWGQVNLVRNPSFEDLTSCYNFSPYSVPYLSPAQFSNRANYPNVTYWIRPTPGTPDYFNRCAPLNGVPWPLYNVPFNYRGTSQPHSGDAYAGMLAYFRFGGSIINGYLETELTAPMVAGHAYYISYYTRLATFQGLVYHNYDSVITALDNLGVAVLDTQMNVTTGIGAILPVARGIMNPVGRFINDTGGWTKVSGTYVAKGGEQWIVIGAFERPGKVPYQVIRTAKVRKIGADSINSYYFIDDVLVTDFTKNITKSTISICPADTPYTVTNTKKGSQYTYLWSTGDTTASIKISKSGTYWSLAVNDTLVSLDTIDVTLLSPSPLGKPLSDTTLCTNYSKDITIGVAKKYDTYSWNTGATTPNIQVNSPGKYILTVTSQCDGVQKDSMQLSVSNNVAPAVFDTSICQYSSVPRLLITGDSIKWYLSPADKNFFTTQPFASGAKLGTVTFYITSTTQCGESAKVPVNIHVLPNEVKTIVTDNDPGELCIGDSVLLQASSDAAAHYLWNTGDTTAVLAIKDSGSYSVIAKALCASDTAYAHQYVFENCKMCLNIPNAFTPNGDGKNDVYRILSHCVLSSFVLHIYNRWGQLVFQSNDITKGWDGTWEDIPQEMGTYFYELTYTANVAQSHQGNSRGDITLIR